MAEAWLAWQRGPDGFERPVVLKRLQARALRKHLVREAHFLAQLHHPHLVQIIALEEERGQIFMVLEWINGVDFRCFLQRARGRRDFVLAVAYVVHAVLEALTYCHTRPAPVIHGDITPQNILISRQGLVKLSDFGIARIEQNSNGGRDESQTLWGNPRFVAPEVLAGQWPTVRSDLFQIGVLLREALQDEPVQTCTAALLGLAERELCIDPQRRSSSAQSLCDDVDRVMEAFSPHWKRLGAQALVSSSASLAPSTQEIIQPSKTRVLEASQKSKRLSALSAALTLMGILALPSALFEAPTLAPIVAFKPQVFLRAPAAIPRAVSTSAKSARALAHLDVQAEPWARVYVNTVFVGDTPQRLALAAGRYRVELVNPLSNDHKTRVFQLAPGQKTQWSMAWKDAGKFLPAAALSSANTPKSLQTRVWLVQD